MTVTIPTTGDEARDFQAIEDAAAVWLDRGYAPVDAEPGEWLVLRHPDGSEVEIEVA